MEKNIQVKDIRLFEPNNIFKLSDQDEILLKLTNEGIFSFGLIDTLAIFKSNTRTWNLRPLEEDLKKSYFKEFSKKIKAKYPNIDILEYKVPNPDKFLYSVKTQWIYKSKKMSIFPPPICRSDGPYKYGDSKWVNILQSLDLTIEQCEKYINEYDIALKILYTINNIKLDNIEITIPLKSDPGTIDLDLKNGKEFKEFFKFSGLSHESLYLSKIESFSNKIEEHIPEFKVKVEISIQYSKSYLTKRLFEIYHKSQRSIIEKINHSDGSYHSLSESEIKSLREYLNIRNDYTKFSSYDFQFNNPGHIITIINFLLNAETFDMSEPSENYDYEGIKYEDNLIDMLNILRK